VLLKILVRIGYGLGIAMAAWGAIQASRTYTLLHGYSAHVLTAGDPDGVLKAPVLNAPVSIDAYLLVSCVGFLLVCLLPVRSKLTQ
jgi:hypothetical protein